MTVTITYSLTNGGSAISSALNHGNASNGQTSTAKTIYIRHDGVNSITGCKFYIREYSGTYSGGASAALDLAELLAWGDAVTAAAFGGFQVNMNATGSFPTANWPTYSSKSPTDGFICKTGTADSVSNAVSLSTSTGATAVETIQSGASPNVRLQCKIQVPTAEDTLGIRQFDSVFTYTYTS